MCWQGFLYGVATGLAVAACWAAHLWRLDRRRRGLSLTRRWR